MMPNDDDNNNDDYDNDNDNDDDDDDDDDEDDNNGYDDDGRHRWWRLPAPVFNNALIPWYPISYLTIASSVFFGGGAYGSLPDAAIWWCLRTGGGGVLTRPHLGLFLHIRP